MKKEVLLCEGSGRFKVHWLGGGARQGLGFGGWSMLKEAMTLGPGPGTTARSW